MTIDTSIGWVLIASIQPPTLHDNTAYVDKLKNSLKLKLKTQIVNISLQLIQEIPDLIIKWKYKVRCLMFKDSSNNWILVHISNPFKKEPLIGLAIDLGTSRIVLKIVNLVTHKIIDKKKFDNPQLSVSPDILERIHHSKTTKGLEHLNNLMINSINKNVLAICHKNEISKNNIHIVSVAGNTTMTHLFLKISPQYIPKEPYIPSINKPGVIDSKDIGIKTSRYAKIFIFPNVGSYFGGDLIAGILYSGMNKNKETAILIDIGTNAEIVIGNKDWMIASAGAAGPALEGSATKAGTIANPGSINRVEINPKTKKITVSTIEDLPPTGICGSGIIDFTAQLLTSGLIDAKGKFLFNTSKKIVTKNGSQFITIVPKNKSATGKSIRISQAAVNSIICSKAAMYTMIETISKTAGINIANIKKFFIAGTFGKHINPKSGIAIGMLPDISLNAYKLIGNSSIGGAVKVLQSADTFETIDNIKNNITYIELNINQNFMNRLSAAKFLPHTEISLFPNHKNIY